MNIDGEVQEHLNQAFFLYEDAEEFEKALQECDNVLKMDSSLAEAHNLRGVILEELGRPFEALGAYRKALQLEPNFPEAESNLSELKAEYAAYNRLVTIATFSYPTEAYIPKTKLESEGIWAFVADADTVTANWLYSNAIGGVKLQVKKDDVDRAVAILNSESDSLEWLEDEITQDEDEVSCPQCNSNNVEYEKYATRLIFLSWLLLTFPIPFLKRKWKCQDCGYTWKTEKAQESQEAP